MKLLVQCPCCPRAIHYWPCSQAATDVQLTVEASPTSGSYLCMHLPVHEPEQCTPFKVKSKEHMMPATPWGRHFAWSVAGTFT